MNLVEIGIVNNQRRQRGPNVSRISYQSTRVSQKNLSLKKISVSLARKFPIGKSLSRVKYFTNQN